VSLNIVTTPRTSRLDARPRSCRMGSRALDTAGIAQAQPSSRSENDYMKKQMLIVALAAACAISTHAVTAQPEKVASTQMKPVAAQTQAALWASRVLGRYHYKAMPLDDAMSEKIFDNYFKTLDSEKLYFVQGDIDRFAPTAHQARRRHQQRRPDPAVRDLQPLPAALHRPHELCARPAQDQARLHRRRNPAARPRKGPVGEERGRGARPVEEARQERLAAPEAGRQGRKGHPRNARQALRELHLAHDAS
jgi:hypothetical protein